MENKEGASLFVPADASPPFCCPGGIGATAETEAAETGAYFGRRGDEADNVLCSQLCGGQAGGSSSASELWKERRPERAALEQT